MGAEAFVAVAVAVARNDVWWMVSSRLDEEDAEVIL
jgi:hypothetical protein